MLKNLLKIGAFICGLGFTLVIVHLIPGPAPHDYALVIMTPGTEETEFAYPYFLKERKCKRAAGRWSQRDIQFVIQGKKAICVHRRDLKDEKKATMQETH